MKTHRPAHVHQTLRRATAEAHHVLDHHRLMQRLTSNDLTRAQYTQSLAAMYRPHARLERRVHASRYHFESGLELSPRLELLEADLLDMGRPIPHVAHTLPDPSEERAFWWGQVYVLEGSRLGSAVIARRVRSSLCDNVPCQFFGRSTISANFNTLLAKLELELEEPDALAQAIAGARAAFFAYKVDLDAFNSMAEPQ